MRRTAAWIDARYRRPIRLAGDPDDEDAGNDDFDEDAEDDEEDWEDEGEEEEEGWRVTRDTVRPPPTHPPLPIDFVRQSS